MEIKLTSETARLVKSLVKSGRYRSNTEVVRKALSLLKQHQAQEEALLREFRKEVQKGIRSANRGKTQPFTQALVDRIKKEGRARLARQTKAKRA